MFATHTSPFRTPLAWLHLRKFPLLLFELLPQQHKGESS